MICMYIDLAKVDEKGIVIDDIVSFGEEYIKNTPIVKCDDIKVKGRAYYSITNEIEDEYVSSVEDVIYYPDLVKVKIDLTSNDIIGFEAVNYALNNVDREFESVISLEEAEQKLGFDYEVISSSKTIIKLDDGKEISAYEFYVERIDGFYFYYINSSNGEIAKVMKLVSVKDSNKLINAIGFNKGEIDKTFAEWQLFYKGANKLAK